MKGFSSGLATGIIFAVLFFLIMIIARMLRGKQAFEVYDERQLQSRFKAYQVSFFVLLCGIGIDACMKLYGLTFYEDPLGEFTAIMAAVGVFAVMNIRNGSFLALNRKRKPFLLLYGVICLCQFLGTIGYWRDGELVADGKLTVRCVSPILLVLFLVIFVMMLIPQNEQEELEEE